MTGVQTCALPISLYLPSKKVTSYKNLAGEYLDRKVFDSIREAKEFYKKYDDIPGAPKIYGNTRFEYVFIGEQHQDMVDWDQDKIVIGVVDIEVGSENGFPDPYEANEPITAITITYINGSTFVFGCGDYEVQGDEIYFKCKDEWTLCKKFIQQ